MSITGRILPTFVCFPLVKVSLGPGAVKAFEFADRGCLHAYYAARFETVEFFNSA